MVAPMTRAPILTDRTRLTRARTRARAGSRDEALFLHREAIDEIKDRLSLVNRRFTSPAIVTGFPDLWQKAFPDALVVADDEVLALEAGRRDLVIHAMALHWANDPVGQLIQSRLALRPDGLCLAVAPGGATLSELRACLAEAESDVTGGLSPRVAPMAEIRDFGDLIQRAGFALPVADSLRLTASYPDPFALMRELRDMGETNSLDQRLKFPTRRAVFEQMATLYRTHHADANGRVLATFELIVLTGWAPDASQQKPMRPGSAEARLADALGAVETSLRDNRH